MAAVGVRLVVSWTSAGADPIEVCPDTPHRFDLLAGRPGARARQTDPGQPLRLGETPDRCRRPARRKAARGDAPAHPSEHARPDGVAAHDTIFGRRPDARLALPAEAFPARSAIMRQERRDRLCQPQRERQMKWLGGRPPTTAPLWSPISSIDAGRAMESPDAPTNAGRNCSVSEMFVKQNLTSRLICGNDWLSGVVGPPAQG